MVVLREGWVAWFATRSAVGVSASVEEESLATGRDVTEACSLTFRPRWEGAALRCIAQRSDEWRIWGWREEEGRMNKKKNGEGFFIFIFFW